MKTVLNHPLVEHKLAILRHKDTNCKLFREVANEITTFLAIEALRDVRMETVEVETPLTKCSGRQVAEKIVIVPILRAGVGMLDAMLEVVPFASVGVLGMQRDEETAIAETYCAKVPRAKGNELALVIDPMLATGGSAIDAVGYLKKIGYTRIKMLSLVSAPEGIAAFEAAHADVPIITAVLDDHLNERHYIVPGLGDAGDRIFATIG